FSLLIGAASGAFVSLLTRLIPHEAREAISTGMTGCAHPMAWVQLSLSRHVFREYNRESYLRFEVPCQQLRSLAHPRRRFSPCLPPVRVRRSSRGRGHSGQRAEGHLRFGLE